MVLLIPTFSFDFDPSFCRQHKKNKSQQPAEASKREKNNEQWQRISSSSINALLAFDSFDLL
jgi:hypothetical protein